MDIDTYILVGGRSSRLGRDKAFAMAGGRTLAARAIATVREAGIFQRVTLVAGSEVQFAIEAIALETPFILDLVPGRGPLSGLHAALSDARSPWIFLLACDMPLLTPDFLVLLAGHISDTSDAVVPIQPDGKLQPLCGLYNVERVTERVEDLVRSPRPTPPMAAIVEEMGATLVPFDKYSNLEGADRIFANINTPADLTEIERLLTAAAGRSD